MDLVAVGVVVGLGQRTDPIPQNFPFKSCFAAPPPPPPKDTDKKVVATSLTFD